MAISTDREHLRRLPQVHRLAERLPAEIPAVWRVEAAQQAIAEARTRLREGGANPEAALEGLEEEARRLAEALARPHLDRVINATGVILHTNLGRAPLGEAVMRQIVRVAAGYSTLEYDLENGVRGSRHTHVERQLVALSGAEAAMAVNNNAAAVLLALSELAHGGEVVVSRGQLVEIGGAFRVPDVMRQSGATLVEVGTTNKTRLSDYEKALTEATRLLLKVHTSNFRLTGFVESVPTEDLAALAHSRGLPLMEDLGSGVLFPLELQGWREPSVTEVVRAGADVVTFSGDKLLGGPQAGLIVGRADIVARLKRHPLARALRVDKMTLSGLEMTLRLYREGRTDEIPLWSLLHQTPEQLWRKARRLALRIRRAAGIVPDGPVEVRPARAMAPVGGGSLPGVALPTAVVALRSPRMSAQALERNLRRCRPAIVARVEDETVLLDVRTVLSEDENDLVRGVAGVLAPLGRATEGAD